MITENERWFNWARDLHDRLSRNRSHILYQAELADFLSTWDRRNVVSRNDDRTVAIVASLRNLINEKQT